MFVLLAVETEATTGQGGLPVRGAAAGLGGGAVGARLGGRDGGLEPGGEVSVGTTKVGEDYRVVVVLLFLLLLLLLLVLLLLGGGGHVGGLLGTCVIW